MPIEPIEESSDEPELSYEERQALKVLIENRDAACPGCGYNLRGLTGDRCPECHRMISIDVLRKPTRAGPFLAGAIGLSIGLGACVIFVLASILTLSFDSHEFVRILVACALLTTALVFWTKHRERVLLLPGGLVGFLIALCYLLSLATIILIVASRWWV